MGGYKTQKKHANCFYFTVSLKRLEQYDCHPISVWSECVYLWIEIAFARYLDKVHFGKLRVTWDLIRARISGGKKKTTSERMWKLVNFHHLSIELL